MTGDIEHGIYPRLAKHLQRELELIGLSLVLFNLGHQQERLRHMLEHAAAMGLRGLFLASADLADMTALQSFVVRAQAEGRRDPQRQPAARASRHRLDRARRSRGRRDGGPAHARARAQGDRLSRPHSPHRRSAASAPSATSRPFARPGWPSTPLSSGTCARAIAAKPDTA